MFDPQLSKNITGKEPELSGDRLEAIKAIIAKEGYESYGIAIGEYIVEIETSQLLKLYEWSFTAPKEEVEQWIRAKEIGLKTYELMTGNKPISINIDVGNF